MEERLLLFSSLFLFGAPTGSGGTDGAERSSHRPLAEEPAHVVTVCFSPL